MAHLKFGPANLGHGPVEAAGQSYLESEQARWEETKELGVTGTLARDFQFGLTGPAPTTRANPDAPLTPTIDRGPEPYNTANRTGEDVIQNVTGGPAIGSNLGPDDGGLASSLKLLVGVGIVLLSVTALGQLFDVQVG